MVHQRCLADLDWDAVPFDGVLNLDAHTYEQRDKHSGRIVHATLRRVDGASLRIPEEVRLRTMLEAALAHGKPLRFCRNGQGYLFTLVAAQESLWIRGRFPSAIQDICDMTGWVPYPPVDESSDTMWVPVDWNGRMLWIRCKSEGTWLNPNRGHVKPLPEPEALTLNTLIRGTHHLHGWKSGKDYERLFVRKHGEWWQTIRCWVKRTGLDGELPTHHLAVFPKHVALQNGVVLTFPYRISLEEARAFVEGGENRQVLVRLVEKHPHVRKLHGVCGPVSLHVHSGELPSQWWTQLTRYQGVDCWIVRTPY